MKLRVPLLILLILFISPFFEVWGEDIVMSGVVKNKVNKKKIPSVSLTVSGTNIGTVSNTDGSFSIKIPDSLAVNGLRAEQLGYKGCFISGENIIANLANPVTIWLEPAGVMLDEVMVYGADPRLLIENAIKKIPSNYSPRRNMFSAFYRETIQKGSRYIGISEAIVNVLKTPYKTRQTYGDRVGIEKGRKLVSQRSSDTLSVKVMGGPTIPIFQDIVKNEDFLFSLQELDYYDFQMEPMTSLDDRQQFVVSFRPKIKTDYPLYKGKVYIDVETCAFTKAEFALDVSDKDKATRYVLRKKPRGLHFKPQEIEFVVTYKYQDGISYLNYISAKIRFKCDWKRRLFSAGYTVYSEMVMVDREDDASAAISRKNSFSQRDIFDNLVDNFDDKDFWKDYNIIEPTESLEKAVLKLRN